MPPQPPPMVLPSSRPSSGLILVLCPDWLLFGDCEIVEDTVGAVFGRSQLSEAVLGPCSEDLLEQSSLK